jgi:hypothetical protein
MAAQPRHGRWTDSLPKIAGVYGSIAVLASGGTWLLQKLYLDKYVRDAAVTYACSPEKVNAIVHEHVDPIVDSLSIMKREILHSQIYSTVQADVLLGPEKAAIAEKRYLAIIKAMEGRSR